MKYVFSWTGHDEFLNDNESFIISERTFRATNWMNNLFYNQKTWPRKCQKISSDIWMGKHVHVTRPIYYFFLFDLPYFSSCWFLWVVSTNGIYCLGVRYCFITANIVFIVPILSEMESFFVLFSSKLLLWGTKSSQPQE